MAEDDDAIAPATILARHKRPSKRGANAQDREQFGGYASACQADRIAGAGEVEIVTLGIAGHVHGRGQLPERDDTALRIRPGDPDQAMRIGKGQRPQQDAVHQAEHRGVGADAKCQRDRGHGGETGILAQQPGAIAHVLPQGLDPAQPPGVLALLPDPGQRAELPQRRVTRLGLRQARPLQRLRPVVDVVRQFLVELAIRLDDGEATTAPAAAACEPNVAGARVTPPRASAHGRWRWTAGSTPVFRGRGRGDRSGSTKGNLARRLFSLTFHSALIQPSCSSLCSAGYSDPSLTCSTSRETCISLWPMATPCSGPRARIFSSRRSSVPWTRSGGLLMALSSVTESMIYTPGRRIAASEARLVGRLDRRCCRYDRGVPHRPD